MTPSRSERQRWLLPRAGEGRHETVAEIALRAPVHEPHTYGVPRELVDSLAPGMLVEVPYGRGNRRVEGWCLRLSQAAWDHTRRPVAAILSPERLLSEALIELGLWVSAYYGCTPGQAFETMLPAATRRPKQRRVAYLEPTHADATGPPRNPESLTDKQRALLDALAGRGRPQAEALDASGVGPGVARKLEQQGWLRRKTHEQIVEPDAAAWTADTRVDCPEDALTLTPEQQQALSAIESCAGAFAALLLFGVPGSGKTEVYVRAIRSTIAAGRQAILLVPEIALATQIVARLERRFDRVAILHSRLTPARRAAALRAVAAGLVDVVIGTRTAVFAPCPRLGLIVVDEEQETSFKSQQAPYFHARDVAVKRAQLEKIPVLLGSATPALETWFNARAGRYQRLELATRVPGAAPPRVQVVETAYRELGQTTAVLSPRLIAALREVIDQQQQAILLHNRRGYAMFLRCERCGLLLRCEHCGAHLVHHRAENAMKCHRCGRRRDVPVECLDDTCRGRLVRSGLAIQRLEAELRSTLPNARLLRLDSDTMRRPGDYAEALRMFERHEADVLLGTQMVAKGLDFPHVRLVGVLEADAALSMPDFRAPERTFQLLVQVAGRAGRRTGDSLALVQAEDPSEPLIAQAMRMDYTAFANETLAQRRPSHEPPFCRLVRFVCADARPGRARDESRRLTEGLTQLGQRLSAKIRVDPAAPCVVPRLRDLLRFEVLVRLPRETAPPRLLAEMRGAKLRPRVQRFKIDVDPLDLL